METNFRPCEPAKKVPIIVNSIIRYIGKHWRGEFSLARSFWLHGIAIDIAWQLVTSFAFKPFDNIMSVRALRGDMWIVWSQMAILIPLLIWQMVGTWRAAGIYRRTRAKRLWPALTKIYYGFSVAITVVTIAGMMAVHGFLIWIDTRPADPWQYTLRLSEDGRDLHFSGIIGFETTTDFETVLTNNPNIERLILNSPGGGAAPAFDTAILIESADLETRVDGDCASACTILFSAGTQRVLGPTGYIGFHSPFFDLSMVGGDDNFATMLDVLLQRFIGDFREQNVQWFIAHNVDEEFIRRGWTTPSEDMWFPEPGELLASRYATHLDLEAIGPGNISTNSADSLLDADAYAERRRLGDLPPILMDPRDRVVARHLDGPGTLSAIATDYPQHREELAAKIGLIFDRGGPLLAARAAIELGFLEIARNKYDLMRRTSNEAVVTYTAVTATIARSLKEQAGDRACATFLADPMDTSWMNVPLPFEQPLWLSHAGDLLAEAARGWKPVTMPGDIHTRGDETMRLVADRSKLNLPSITAGLATLVDRGEIANTALLTDICTFRLAFLDYVLTMSTEEAAAVLRWDAEIWAPQDKQ